MGETDYNALLYDKMKAEQDKYRDWLLNQPPEEILNHTYEYTMREDIVMCMEELELSPKQAKALLKEAGIAYASEQICELVARGVDGVHLYTMNHPCVSRRIWSNVKPFFV